MLYVKKATDFSRLKVILDSSIDQLKSLKADDAEWCSEVESTVDTLESKHKIIVCDSVSIARRSSVSMINTVDSFQKSVVVPYINKLIENI